MGIILQVKFKIEVRVRVRLMFSSKVGIILNFFTESVLIMQPIRKWRGIVVCFSIGPDWVPQLEKI